MTLLTLSLQTERIRRIHRVVPRVGVRLPGLRHVGIDGQELPRRRFVVAPY
jgi:hypothetical protein